MNQDVLSAALSVPTDINWSSFLPLGFDTHELQDNTLLRGEKLYVSNETTPY